MKNLELDRICFAIMIAVTLFSCTKEKSVQFEDQDNIIDQLKFINVNDRIQDHGNYNKDVIVIVSWDEWGRTSRECRGFGLCHAKWFPQFESSIPNPVPGTGGASILEYNHVSGQYYFDVLLASNPPAAFTLSDPDLIIDDDILLDTEKVIGTNLKIVSGIYSFDKLLSQYGGYRIYLN